MLVLFRTSMSGAIERGAVPTAMVPEAYTLRRVDSTRAWRCAILAGTRPWCAFSDLLEMSMKIGVLASHEGTTLQAIIDACTAGALATLVPGAGDCAPTLEAIDDALIA